jgi:hypothetical protein
MRYKEGKDFEWVPMTGRDGKVVRDGRGDAVKTRRFFTKAEKEAMKSKGKPKAETKPKPKPKSKPKSSGSSSAPTKSKRPMRRTGKMNDDAKAERTNSNEKYGTGSGPRSAASSGRSSAPAPSATTNSPSLSGNDTSAGSTPTNRSNPDKPVSTGYGTLANAKNRMEAFKVSRENKTINGVSFAEWKKLTRAERVEKNLPLTNQEFMRAMRLKGKTPGMAKGGMVKSGNKDYKKSGMFYKSDSPRGYK